METIWGLINCWWFFQNGRYFENSATFLISIHLLHNTAMSALSANETCIHRKISTCTVRTTLPWSWKEPRCLSLSEQRKTWCYVLRILYSNIKWIPKSMDGSQKTRINNMWLCIVGVSLPGKPGRKMAKTAEAQWLKVVRRASTWGNIQTVLFHSKVCVQTQIMRLNVETYM